jgi:dihydroorotate dehydrogenase
MGFNNDGVHKIASRLEKRKSDIVIGGNIGKNKDTANNEASSDYVNCFTVLADLVDYFVINISSPNTVNLRALQEKDALEKLCNDLQNQNQKRTKKKPLLLKIAPDLNIDQFAEIADVLKVYHFDGVVVNNTSVRRDLLSYTKEEIEAFGAGGISGKVIREFSDSVLQNFRTVSDLPIIAVGGIMSAKDAKRKLELGANLLQIYTGFIYRGPDLIREILESLCD